MKLVITGALGHIGSRLIRDLPAAFPGARIVMVDNMATQRYCSLFDLPASGAYRFVEADIMKMDLEPAFAGADAVLHLAAVTDAATSFERKDLVEEVNFRGTERVALACARAGVPLFVPSTTSVYGSQDSVVDEGCLELKPQSPYAESKLRSENRLGELGREQGLKFVVCRFGTIFGISPGMRFHTAVNKFVWQACMGQPLSVWRTALRQKRPYLDLGDASRAVAFILRTKRFDGEIYNVVTINAAVADIVDAIRAHIPDVRVEYVDTAIMNQLSYDVASDKFAALGFRCSGRLEDGIAESIRLLRQARSGERGR